MRLRFITSTPLNISSGSGTYIGITALAKALQNLDVSVELLTPSFRIPIYTAQRLLFNQSLKFRRLTPCDATIGFDMDGYTLDSRTQGLHIASIKGVIADEMRFESGLTHATMRVQAACERVHVHKVRAVITTSQYSAQRIRELYQINQSPHIVPELIDLETWNELLNGMPRFSPVLGEVGTTFPRRFTVLSVTRFYPRKRIEVLLRAAARLRHRIPELEIRIVGGGPEQARLIRICEQEQLGGAVTWRENIPQQELVSEYEHCDIFCLPSVQEGFGIVFLEAMASGKPIVAARAAAVPEVVQHGLLVEPDNEEALAAAIERLYQEKSLRDSLASAGAEFVKRFDAPLIARQFVCVIEQVLSCQP
jgi:glycosyltransferase involved in cell wall biosynthesis